MTLFVVLLVARSLFASRRLAHSLVGGLFPHPNPNPVASLAQQMGVNNLDWLTSILPFRLDLLNLSFCFRDPPCLSHWGI